MRARSMALAVGLAATVVAILSSCAEPPAAQAREARMAFANLRDLTKGQKWAAGEFAAAEASLQAAEKELASQTARLSIMRDYEKARELFAAASADAELARQAALEGKKAAEKLARDTLDAAITALAHARTAMLVAPAARESRAVWARLEQDLTRHEVALEEARNLIVAEDYLEACSKADGVLDRVSATLHTIARSARR